MSESQISNLSNYEKSAPKLNPDDLRRELFKFFYATQNPEKFDLFKKADASEFLQSILELVHFSLNQNPEKKDSDSLCGTGKGDHCIIHDRMLLSVYSESSCRCNPSKVRKQAFHQNNFLHLINAQEVIDMQHTLIKKQKEKGKIHRTVLEAVQHKLMGISKELLNK